MWSLGHYMAFGCTNSPTRSSMDGEGVPVALCLVLEILDSGNLDSGGGNHFSLGRSPS